MVLTPEVIGADSYNKFYKALAFTLPWEGGYTNDPSDPGGETKYGISKRAHPSVDIKNLTPEQAATIYYQEYWMPLKADTVVYPGVVALFDTGVNNGVGRTLSWISNPFDPEVLLDKRAAFDALQVKKNPQEQKFLAGWLNRINDLKKYLVVNTLTEGKWGSLG